MVEKNLPVSINGQSPEIVAREAILQAGGMLRESFRLADAQVSFKGRADVVTNIDLEVEEVVRDFLLKQFPDFGFLGEELGSVSANSPYQWVVDPIDGTANFAKGIPHISTTLALTYNDKPIIGATLDPLRDHLFYAREGEGFTFNGNKVSFVPEKTFELATIGMDSGSDEELVKRTIEIALNVLPVHRIRIMGSAALAFAYVATGWYDLYLHFELKPWDVAAGLLSIRQSTAALDCLGPGSEKADLFSAKYLAGNKDLIDICKFWD